MPLLDVFGLHETMGEWSENGAEFEESDYPYSIGSLGRRVNFISLFSITIFDV
jgi:hypothetical protein